MAGWNKFAAGQHWSAKIIITVLLTVLFAGTAGAGNTYGTKKTEGSFAPLKGMTAFGYAEDWSQLLINGMEVSDWLDYRQFEQPEYDAKKELETELKPSIKNLREALNEKLGGHIRFTPGKAQTYKLTISPLNIDKKGNMILECVFSDNSGNQVVKFYVSGRGGTFGSMSNLWGDGFGSAGRRLAKRLINELLPDQKTSKKLADFIDNL